MNRKKWVGFLALIVGIILMVCGIQSSHSVREMSGRVPGHTIGIKVKKNARHFDGEVLSYLIGGAILVLGGGVLIFISKKRNKK